MPLSADRIIARSVSRLIKERPILVVLHRERTSKNLRGGRDVVETFELDPQEVRLVPFKRRLTLEYSEMPTEQSPRVEYIMTGHHSLDVQAGDWFYWQPPTSSVEEVWRVDAVSALQYHRVQATITRRQERPA